MNKKDEILEVKVPDDTVHETTIYYFKALCPYCGTENTIEQEVKIHRHHCDECSKEFSIRYTH